MIPSDEEYERPPFNLLFILLLSSTAILGQVLAILVLAVLTGKESISLIGIGTIFGYGVAILIAAPRILPPPEVWLGFLRPPPVAWLAALLLLPAAIIASEIDNVTKALLAAPPSEQVPTVEGFQIYEFAVLLIVVLPAVHEIFFRGVLQAAVIALLGAARGIAALALIAGLSWTILSGGADPKAFLAALLQGISLAWVLGVLRHCSGSIWPGLLLSAAIGAIGWFALQGAFGIPGFDDPTAAHTPLAWLAPSAACVGIGLGLCRAMVAQRASGPEGESRREHPESEENSE